MPLTPDPAKVKSITAEARKAREFLLAILASPTGHGRWLRFLGRTVRNAGVVNQPTDLWRPAGGLERNSVR